MNGLFRAYTAEHQLIGEGSHIYQPSNTRNVYSGLENDGCNKSKL
jgi:hypothetical protein